MQVGASKYIVVETLVVLGSGVLIALAANFVSPRGLSLGRNYFPTISVSPQAGGLNTNGPAGTAPVADPHSPEAVAARLHAKGLQPVSAEAARQLYNDPLYQQELIVFVDARDQKHYEEGHIPGAYQFDRYYPEKHLPTVVPVCLNANRVMVYCTGGACEDSEFAAIALTEAGIPADRVVIYTGGITEWTAQKGPIELGSRGSGNLRPPTP
jgi:rhodanese-related sulfurtransferase